jgi:cytochrome c553
MKYFPIIILASLLSNFAIADDSFDRGKEKSVTCSACHGTDGNSNNKMYPRLAGQYKNYLIHSLQAYKSGSRKNAIMSGFAAGLSEQDIIDLSTYYSKQKGLNIIPKN